MSQSRRCEIIKATNNRWYLVLGNFEYAHNDWDCTVYGTFNSEDSVWDYIHGHFANPGGGSIDSDGTITPEEIKKMGRWYETIR